jgi:hypothetical protein
MGTWREYVGDRRRSTVNIIPTTTSSGSSSTGGSESNFCPRCSAQLSYLTIEDVWACTKCAWNLPKHLLEEPEPSASPVSSLSSSTSQNNKVGTVDMITEAEELENNVVPVASKPRRSEELANRAKRLPGEDSDTAMLQAKGMTLIDSNEVLPAGDSEVLSSADLHYTNDKSRITRRYH